VQVAHRLFVYWQLYFGHLQRIWYTLVNYILFVLLLLLNKEEKTGRLVCFFG
jgi:hypothetical protein